MTIFALAFHAGAASLRDAPSTEIYYALRDANGDARPDAVGRSVALHGILTVRPFLTNGVWVTFFQDETGALRLTDRNARLANRNSGRPNFDEGDEIKVRGILGIDELSVQEVQLIRNGEAPKPRDVWTSDLHNNRFHAQLVRVVGEVARGPRDKEIEFFIRDATGQTPLVLKPEFLMTDKGEFSYRLWKGGQIKVVGIAMRNTNAPASAGLSLLLRRPSDVEFVPPPPPPPSRLPFYLAIAAATLLAILALYYWERRRIAEARHKETSKLLHELKRSQAEIKKQASFAQLNPNPVLELFADGTLTYWNEAAQEMTSGLRCEFVKDLLPPDVGEIVTQALAAPHARQRREVKLNGRTISWSFFPIPEITSVHAYAQDITDQLSLEMQLRQAQKIESIGQLAAGVAHDFNNLIGVVQGYTSFALMRPDLPQKVIEPLNEILSAAERAGNLTRQLLTFSRRQTMEPRALDLNDLLANLTRMLRRLIGGTVRLNFARSAHPAWLRADPGMLEQVIMNLAINARDAMPEGGELSLSIENVSLLETEAAQRFEARAGDFVVITVVDTGCGMDDATLKRIFEPFFTTKESGKGTGLGLATVHGIVKQHGGWIEVSSHPGKGTTFRIYFPAADEVAQPGDDKLIRLPLAGGSETILVVEDDPALRKLVRSVLEEYGYGVCEAATAADALAVWRQHREKIQLLFTDIVLPEGMSGWKLAETLRMEQPQLKVVYSTGFDAENANRRIDAPANHVLLHKPYPVQSLVHVIRECLDNVSVAQAVEASKVS
ncbi:MAG TPA: ATP-binding protein [Methylomirabilota bacterium]|nr:ATP-binding protein [Methylomirabilota bacterium]